MQTSLELWPTYSSKLISRLSVWKSGNFSYFKTLHYDHEITVIILGKIAKSALKSKHVKTSHNTHYNIVSVPHPD